MVSVLHRHQAMLAVFAVLAAAGGVDAARAATEPTLVSEDTENTDDIKGNLERRDQLEEEFLEKPAPRWIREYKKARKEWFQRIRLDIGASYGVAGLAAFGSGNAVSGFSGDFTILGTWQLVGAKRHTPLDLRFRLRDRHSLGGRAASEVAGDSGGVFWNMIDGFNNAGFEIPDLHLVQHLPFHDIEIRYGQMTIDSQFDRHALRSSKQAFFNRAFSSNPAVAFPRFGAGATMKWNPNPTWGITLGACSVQGTQNGTQVDFNFGSGDFFTALQAGRDFTFFDNPARIQGMVWHSDPVHEVNLPEAKGFGLTFENWIESTNNRLFLRLAWADGAASDADRLVAAGLAIERRENDLFGVALGIGRDSSGTKDWQCVLETFYRWQVGPHFHVSPEAQLVFGSGLRPDHPFRLVAGIRGQLAF